MARRCTTSWSSIDDEKMEISHVIRGEDHISNTPKHIALIRALGYREPRFGHIPLILNADRSKMSKRKSQTSVTAYREEGYLPEAMVNFLAFLGWSPGTEEEIFTLDELIARFDLAHVHKARRHLRQGSARLPERGLHSQPDR